MADGYVYARREPVSREQLVALLKTLTDGWNLPAYRYQEREEAIKLDWADSVWGQVLEQEPLALWPSGRVFCWQFEARWHAAHFQADHYDVQVVSERDPQLPVAEWNYQRFEAGEEYSTFLWGERRAQDVSWAETRIPRAQDYPVTWDADKTIAAIRARDYRRDGIVCLTRLVRVEATRKPKE